MLSILPSSQIQIEKQGVLHHQRREPFHADISGVFSAPADTFTPTVKTTPLPFFGRIIKLDELENPREYPFKSRIEGTSPLRHYWNLFLSGTITAGVDPTKFWIDADTLRTMKPVGFYSVLANKLPADVKTILDPFAGGGGSAIGFALGGKHVIANDLDPDKVAMLKHNARLFQFPTSRLSIIQGDAKELLSTVKADCLHLDPPWGGFFSLKEPFRLKDLGQFGDPEFLEPLLRQYKHVIITLPQNFDLNEVKQFQDLILDSQKEIKIMPCTVDPGTQYYVLYFHPASALSPSTDLNRYKSTGSPFDLRVLPDRRLQVSMPDSNLKYNPALGAHLKQQLSPHNVPWFYNTSLQPFRY